MKKLLIIIWSLMPFYSLAQEEMNTLVYRPDQAKIDALKDFKVIIEAYEKDCSEIVFDTIEQNGYIEYELIPVVTESGTVSHYALGNPDTTWNKVDCPEYKEGDNQELVWSSITSGYYIGSDMEDLSSASLTLEHLGPVDRSTKQEKQRISITRQYVCEVKKRQVLPFSHHFWNWIKKQ